MVSPVVHIKGMYESKVIEDRDVEFDLGEGSTDIDYMWTL